jgi:hypothetical protein
VRQDTPGSSPEGESSPGCESSGDERPSRPSALTRRGLLATLGTAATTGLAGCSLLEDESDTTPAQVANGGQRTTRPVGSGPGGGGQGGDGAAGESGPGDRDDEDREPAELEPPESLPYADDYDRLVDVVAAGADPEGTRSILDVLSAEAGEDTLLYFPPGRYLMGGEWELSTFENFAMVGGPATLVPAPGYTGYLLALGWDGGGRHARFENFTFDLRNPRSGARPLQILADDLVVRDVSVVGRQETGRGMMRFDVTDPDGTGLVERMLLPDGAAVETGTAGCLVGPTSHGTIRFRDCRIEGFPNNGLYASPAKGRVEVLGGYYANNGIASVRVSGDSLVRGVTVRCDDDGRPLDNMRGIRLRHGKSILVEDCTVELTAATYSDGAITLEQLLESATVRNTTIRVDVDLVPAIRVKSPARPTTLDETPIGEPRIRIEGVQIDGAAADNSAVYVVDRDDCRFDGLCVHQTGDRRNGLHLVRSQGSVLRHALIDVTGNPFVLENSPLEKIDVTVAGTSPESIPGIEGSDHCG